MALSVIVDNVISVFHKSLLIFGSRHFAFRAIVVAPKQRIHKNVLLMVDANLEQAIILKHYLDTLFQIAPPLSIGDTEFVGLVKMSN